MESVVLPCIPTPFLWKKEWLESFHLEVQKQLIRIESTIYVDPANEGEISHLIHVVINHERTEDGKMVDDYRVYRLMEDGEPEDFDADKIMLVDHQHPGTKEKYQELLVLDPQTDYIPNSAITWAIQQDPTEDRWVLEFYDLESHGYLGVQGSLEELIPTLTTKPSEEDTTLIQQHLHHRFGWGLDTNQMYLPLEMSPMGNWYQLPELGKVKSSMGYNLLSWMLSDKNEIINVDYCRDVLIGIPVRNHLVITGESRVRNELEPTIRILLETNVNLRVQPGLSVRFGDIYDELHSLMEVQITQVDHPLMMVGDIWFEPSPTYGFELRFSIGIKPVPNKHQPFSGCLIAPKDIMYPEGYVAPDVPHTLVKTHPWVRGEVRIYDTGGIDLVSKEHEFYSGV